MSQNLVILVKRASNDNKTWHGHGFNRPNQY
jgi:hypothetical protein